MNDHRANAPSYAYGHTDFEKEMNTRVEVTVQSIFHYYGLSTAVLIQKVPINADIMV